jgi:tellurite resistance protein
MVMTAAAMQHLSVIATAAADGRIDHVERPAVREAADMLIATVLPVSSHGDAA